MTWPICGVLRSATRSPESSHGGGLVAEAKKFNVEDVIRGNIIGRHCVEGVELVLGQIPRSEVRPSPGFGQRQAQLHNQDSRKQMAVEGGCLVAEHVRHDDVDAPVKVAAGEVAGVLDADALLQVSLASVPRCGVTCDDEVTNVVDVDNRCAVQRLDQP